MKRPMNVATLAMALLMAGSCAPSAVAPVSAPATVVSPIPASNLPALTSGTAVVISKSARSLKLLNDGKLVASFPVVLGGQPTGRKRFEGDLRTPEGLYQVTAVRKHRRWRYFIAINYPNEEDRRIYRQEVQAGLVPLIDAVPLPIGGAIGIHGNDRPKAQDKGIDWTKGCIAMTNEDVARLARIVKQGTPILIQP